MSLGKDDGHTMHSRLHALFITSIALVLSACGPTAPTSTTPTTTTVPAAGSAPVVTAITPAIGPTDGGTSVTITGSGFTGATAVHFGAAAATAYTFGSDTSITATSPAAADGTVGDVTVTTPIATSATGAPDLFTWGQNGLTGIALSASSVRGGTPVIATIAFALPVSTAVPLPLTWNSDPAGSTAVLLPTRVTIPAGASSATFQITTFFVSSPEQISVSATYSNVTVSAEFTITP